MMCVTHSVGVLKKTSGIVVWAVSLMLCPLKATFTSSIPETLVVDRKLGQHATALRAEWNRFEVPFVVVLIKNVLGFGRLF